MSFSQFTNRPVWTPPVNPVWVPPQPNTSNRPVWIPPTFPSTSSTVKPISPPRTEISRPTALPPVASSSNMLPHLETLSPPRSPPGRRIRMTDHSRIFSYPTLYRIWIAKGGRGARPVGISRIKSAINQLEMSHPETLDMDLSQIILDKDNYDHIYDLGALQDLFRAKHLASGDKSNLRISSNLPELREQLRNYDIVHESAAKLDGRNLITPHDQLDDITDFGVLVERYEALMASKGQQVDYIPSDINELRYLIRKNLDAITGVSSSTSSNVAQEPQIYEITPFDVKLPIIDEIIEHYKIYHDNRPAAELNKLIRETVNPNEPPLWTPFPVQHLRNGNYDAYAGFMRDSINEYQKYLGSVTVDTYNIIMNKLPYTRNRQEQTRDATNLAKLFATHSEAILEIPIKLLQTGIGEAIDTKNFPRLVEAIYNLLEEVRPESLYNDIAHAMFGHRDDRGYNNGFAIPR